MPIYSTGKTRTITVTGAWTGQITAKWICSRTLPIEPNRLDLAYYSYVDTIDVRALGAVILYRPLEVGWPPTYPAGPTCSATYPTTYDVRQTIKLYEDTPYEISTFADGSLSYTVADGFELDETPEAEWTMTATLELFFEVTDPIVDSDSDGFPDYGGAASKDFLTGRSVRYFERLQVGSTLTVEVTGIAPLTLADTVSTAESNAVGDITHAIDRRATIVARKTTHDLTISGTFAGLACPAPYSQTEGGNSFSATGGFALSATNAPTDSTFTSCYGYSLGSPDMEYNTDIRLYGPDGALFSGSENLTIENGTETQAEVLAPNYTATMKQVLWSGFADLNGVAKPSLGDDQRGKVRCWLTSASHDPLDWRIMWRGLSWIPATLRHESEVVLADGSSATGWTGVTSSGGRLVVS